MTTILCFSSAVLATIIFLKHVADVIEFEHAAREERELAHERIEAERAEKERQREAAASLGEGPSSLEASDLATGLKKLIGADE